MSLLLRFSNTYLDVGKQDAHIIHGINVQFVELGLHGGIRALVHFAAYLIVHDVGQNCGKDEKIPKDTAAVSNNLNSSQTQYIFT